MAHPRRARSISIGPQSAADAHEALALRREMRQERRQSGGAVTTGTDRKLLIENMIAEEPKPSERQTDLRFPAALPTPSSSNNDLLSTVVQSQHDNRPLTPEDSTDGKSALSRTPSQDRRLNEKEERELFAQISKPRVRYDVEVVTKIFVYGGKFVDRTTIDANARQVWHILRLLDVPLYFIMLDYLSISDFARTTARTTNHPDTLTIEPFS